MISPWDHHPKENTRHVCFSKRQCSFVEKRYALNTAMCLPWDQHREAHTYVMFQKINAHVLTKETLSTAMWLLWDHHREANTWQVFLENVNAHFLKRDMHWTQQCGCREIIIEKQTRASFVLQRCSAHFLKNKYIAQQCGCREITIKKQTRASLFIKKWTHIVCEKIHWAPQCGGREINIEKQTCAFSNKTKRERTNMCVGGGKCGMCRYWQGAFFVNHTHTHTHDCMCSWFRTSHPHT